MLYLHRVTSPTGDVECRAHLLNKLAVSEDLASDVQCKPRICGFSAVYIKLMQVPLLVAR